jgi:hypothetical protein
MLALGFAALFLALFGQAAALAQEGSIAEARVTWYGVYGARDDSAVKDETALLGERTVSTGIEPPTTNSDRIPAILHTRFGFGFTLSGEPVGRLVRLRWVRNFPPPGLINSQTGERHLREESEIVVRAADKDLFVGYLFDANEELAPGPWSFELWQGDRELLEQSFIVYRP